MDLHPPSCPGANGSYFLVISNCRLEELDKQQGANGSYLLVISNCKEYVPIPHCGANGSYFWLYPTAHTLKAFGAGVQMVAI